ncbi:hypothetical protein [Streptomyces sp. NPDC006463]|uniref:hypothetical protein n=1 Tax=Streptomyces sp. NPDC006463 TaxID=3364746 RepID=UPI00369A404D
MIAVSAAFLGGGALLPTSAFAAPAAPRTVEAATLEAGHVGHAKSSHEDNVKKHSSKKHNSRNNEDKKHGKIKDVENMPGCKFYQGKVYCEHKPEKPAPVPAPKAEDSAASHRENPDRVPTPGSGQAPAGKSPVASG